MLLGRPWLRQAKVKQNWDEQNDYIKIEKNGETYKIYIKALGEAPIAGGARVCMMN